MAKKNAPDTDEVLPANLTDESVDPRDAEIERLRQELADAKGAAPNLSGGRFTCSIKDGPKLTIEAKPGERPEDAFLRVGGIHSTPHRIEVHEAAPDAPIGWHTPNGQVQSLVGIELYQPIVPTAVAA